MAKAVAVTEAIRSLADVEARFGLQRTEEEGFSPEWQASCPELTDAEQADLTVLRRRLLYHRADGDLLEGTVTLLLVAPLLEQVGFYDPPFKLKAEAAVEVAIDDGEEILRGRIDILILQSQLWVMILESKKTTISLRSALPQALAYMLSNPTSNQPTFGMLTNGDEIVFVKLAAQSLPQYDLSRAFSIYTVASELRSAFQVLKYLSQRLV